MRTRWSHEEIGLVVTWLVQHGYGPHTRGLYKAVHEAQAAVLPAERCKKVVTQRHHLPGRFFVELDRLHKDEIRRIGATVTIPPVEVPKFEMPISMGAQERLQLSIDELNQNILNLIDIMSGNLPTQNNQQVVKEPKNNKKRVLLLGCNQDQLNSVVKEFGTIFDIRGYHDANHSTEAHIRNSDFIVAMVKFISHGVESIVRRCDAMSRYHRVNGGATDVKKTLHSLMLSQPVL